MPCCIKCGRSIVGSLSQRRRSKSCCSGRKLPRLIFETEIWPSQMSVSIKVATDARDFAWGGHTLGGQLLTSRDIRVRSEYEKEAYDFK